MATLPNYRRDVAASLQSEFTVQAIDSLLYYLYDADLDKAQRQLVKDALLSNNRNGVAHYNTNGQLVTSDFCAQYAQLRSIGLSQRDAAASLNITVHRLESLLYGEGLNEQQHEMILNAEVSSEARVKQKCLTTIDNAVQSGDWKAAIAFLEKRFPQEYGRRLEVKSQTNVTWSAEDCASSAQAARDDLERIRAERDELEGIEQEKLYVDSDSTK